MCMLEMLVSRPGDVWSEAGGMEAAAHKHEPAGGFVESIIFARSENTGVNA